MKKRILHIWIVLAVICIASVTIESVRALSLPAENSRLEEVNVEISDCDDCGRGWQENRGCPTGNTFVESNQSQRVGSSRLPRLSSNNGGSSGRDLYLQKTQDKYNLLNFASLLLCYERSRSHSEAESPRLYYVIALRRILC